MEKITIIGSGLTGPLLSILFAKRGYKVELYEKRLDPRQESISAGRSINLALSHRGIKALQLAAKYDRRYRSEVKRIIKKIEPFMNHCE